MEFQFFYPPEIFWMRLRRVQPLYQRLRELFASTSYGPLLAMPKQDFALACTDLPQLASIVRDALPALIEQAVQDESEPWGVELEPVELMVLDRHLVLDVRLPTHDLLRRLHEFWTTMADAERSRVDIPVLIVPDLSSSDHYLLRILREATAELRVEEIGERLQAEYARIQTVRELTAEVHRSMAKDAALMQQRSILEQHLTRLSEWNLVSLYPDRETAVATQKAQLIRL